VIDRLKALRMDTTPLRASRDFRLLFLAGSVFYFGAMVSYVAIPFQVYKLTGSNFAVGAIGLVELAPIVVFGLYGGALADHVDRRKLLIATGLGQAVFTAILAANAFRDEPDVWVIFAVSVALASCSALQRPSREALLPRTVTHDQLPAANALSSFGIQMGLLAGPAVGGLLAAYVGIGWCFVIDAGALVIASYLYLLMRSYPHREQTTPPSLAGIKEGMVYAFRRRDLLGTYFVDIVAMMFAAPVVLFPAIADQVFGQPQLLGMLYTSEVVGAMAATALSGWTARVHHHGRAIVLAAAGFGAMVALAGLMPNIWLVALFLALACGFDMISGIFRSTVWSQTIPESMRGRLAGIEMLSYSVGPLAGQVRGGVTADLWSVRGAVVSGGLACVAGVGITAAWLRDFWAYDARTDEHAIAERAVRAAAGEA
jgi:MFS family permease